MRDDFVNATEQYRRELLAHCYRMLGSVHEAEDQVQETYLRAWRGYAAFAGRSSVRVWLYRIATNVCLTALTRRGRRELPSGLGGPADDPATPPDLAGPEVAWLEPLPDRLVDDPAVIVAARDSLRLALIASLQYLPARQRAVLLLREVLAFPAAEVATMLDLSTAAVKSLLQRARARLDEVTPGDMAEPTTAESRALLARYIKAFENADAEELGRLLRADAVLEGPPSRTWFAGRATCVPYLATQVLGQPGDWRLLPTSANGQPTVAAYYRGQAFGVGVLTVAGAEITRITVFGDPALVRSSGLPESI